MESSNNNSEVQKINGIEPGNIHPNGRPVIKGLVRPLRNDETFFDLIFPDNHVGRLLQGIIAAYLIKQEPRMGWAHKSATSDTFLESHPTETVASHQWGVAYLIMIISQSEKFKEQLPDFNTAKAYEMALLHDIPELITGDITPRCGISTERKHELESAAMKKITNLYDEPTRKVLNAIYKRYEDRTCNESKFVKDCDKLDFMLTGFKLERQGYGGNDYSEFYHNTRSTHFFTNIATDLAETLSETRDLLRQKNQLFITKS